jgi:predicted RNase H-like nuclease (RuvC/YqgF family)
VAELDHKAEHHAFQVEMWKAEELRWCEEMESCKFKIAELETDLDNSRDARKRLEQEALLRTVGATERRITELESELAKLKFGEKAWISDIQHVTDENAGLRNKVTELESTITALRSGALPWRPIGEYEIGRIAAFRHSNPEGYWASCALSGGATHFIYLDQPSPKPAPKVVAWAVVNVNGDIAFGSDEVDIMFSAIDPRAESWCRIRCQDHTDLRAVRLVILED